MSKQTSTIGENAALKEELVAALGAAAVLTDTASLDFYAHDAFASGHTAICVVRPGTLTALQEAVRICARAQVAMVPRGGGASYTDGYLAKTDHILFDLSAIDFIEVDEINNFVRVGAGTTWAALKVALEPLGLRTPFWGPFSGIVASIGGSVSQNTISHGSGRHGITAQSVLGMEVVLADGTMISTVPSTATRFYGPDLTGLFTGDCGALGIKASITLPLLANADAFDCVSFAFSDFSSFHKALATTQREGGLEDEHFSFDRALSQAQVVRNDGFMSKLRIARNVIRVAPNFFAGLIQLLKLAVSGGRELKIAQYTLHFIVEGGDKSEVKAKVGKLRRLVAPFGSEIANSAATFVRAIPFAPMFNLLGPKGERWVPVHGLFDHAATDCFHSAFKQFLADQKFEMDRHGLWVGTLFVGLGSHGIMYEVAIYWPDEISSYHRQMLGDDYLSTIPSYPRSTENRAYAEWFKQALIDLMSQHGATYYQIGRAYPYLDRIDPLARALLQSIKHQLDPANLMNPGVLGLEAK